MNKGFVTVGLGGLTGALVFGVFACGGQSPPPSSDTEMGSSGVQVDESAGSTSIDLDDTTGVFETEGVDPETATSGCGEVQVTVEQEIPTLVLLVDQSGSMTADFSGVDRWQAVYDTLMAPGEGVVQQLEGQVRFGLTLYSSVDGFEGGECPMLTTIEPALDNFDAIDAVYADEDPIDETPTGESLAAVAQQLAAFDADGPKGIVLATDGEPDTCATPNPQEGQPESLQAAEDAFAAGISTFIISVGNEVGADHLQEMANVGVGKAADAGDPAPYYQALNPEQLVEAFEEIVGSFVSCTFTVDGDIDLDKACDGTVTLDGEPLECGVDYEVTDESTLELKGEACDKLKDGSPHTVDASWPCGAIVPAG